MNTIVIPGEPVGKQRPRVTRHGTYTPKKTKAYEDVVKLLYRHHYGENPSYEGAVALDITAVFSVPKSWSKRKREMALSGMVRPHKPDFDNIAKIISDALNGIAYKDDAQVYRCTVEKMYGEEPKVIVKVMFDENEVD